MRCVEEAQFLIRCLERHPMEISSPDFLPISTQILLAHEIMLVKDAINYFFCGELPRACALTSSKKYPKNLLTSDGASSS